MTILRANSEIAVAIKVASVAEKPSVSVSLCRYVLAWGDAIANAGAVVSIRIVADGPGFSTLPATSVARARTPVLPCAVMVNGAFLRC